MISLFRCFTTCDLFSNCLLIYYYKNIYYSPFKVLFSGFLSRLLLQLSLQRISKLESCCYRTKLDTEECVLPFIIAPVWANHTDVSTRAHVMCQTLKSDYIYREIGRFSEFQSFWFLQRFNFPRLHFCLLMTNDLSYTVCANLMLFKMDLSLVDGISASVSQ